jgi:hypothetical protein
MATAAQIAKNPLFDDLPAVFAQPQWDNLERRWWPALRYALLLDAFSRVFLEHGRRPADASTSLGPEDPLPGRHSLEERIAGLPLLAVPWGKTPQFLEWLGAWVALSDRVELAPHKKADLIANALRLYAFRGTKRYVEEMLGYYQFPGAAVDEPDFPSMQIGRVSTVGRDTYLGGAPAHFFRVTLVMPRSPQDEYNRLLSLAAAVIDLSKPAHTWYDLRIIAPAMQIGMHSTIGADTLLIAPEPTGKD